MKIYLCFALIFLAGGAILSAAEVTLELSAGKADKPAGTIVSAEIEGLPDGTKVVTIDPGGATAQVSGRQILWRLTEPLKAGETGKYTAKPASAESPAMTCTETDDTLQLRQGDRDILAFRKTPTAEAKNHPPFYTRTGYIHPLLTPGGKSVTGDYPADHVHQHALFFAWTRTRFEGKKTEFWNQKLEKGKISYRKTLSTQSGPNFCEFTIENLYENGVSADTSKPILNETWQVRAWHQPENENYRIVDLSIEQKCAGTSPLTIEKYHYGGMAIRGNADWLAEEKDAPPPGHFLTSGGHTRADGNHTRPDWVSMHGPLDGGYAAVTIMAHPGNFRHPQHVRLHPSKPYFVFAPMVEAPFDITPEEPYRAEYRIVLADVEPDRDLLNQLYQSYAE